ncbi:MAG: glycosyltransferase family 4 protein [Anaerolineae bacterium]|nr:glycosyltransferase family 4 protein [Anaerolineae bacterium]
MRILAVHNRYLLGGGEDLSHSTEVALLRSHGHEVDEMIDDNRRIARLGNLRAALRTIWSTEAFRQIAERLRKSRYDIILVQNFFPLISPSIYYAASREGTPVIQFIRNYRLICLNAYLLRNGKICEDCVGRAAPWPGVLHGCYRGSRAASLVVAAMLVVHRLLGTWNKKVNRFVTLTELGKEKLIAGGIRAEKIVVRSNFIHPDPGIEQEKDEYALFVGRLSPEKGIEPLLDGWGKMPVDKKLILVGNGPLLERLIQKARFQPNLEVVGALPLETTLGMIRGAKFLIFPSILYEGMPRTIIEAFATGTPVIASNLGAMADMVEHGSNGFLFPAGDGIRLAEMALAMYSDPDLYARMRLKARQAYETHYSSGLAYQKMIQIFEDVLQEKKSNGRT